jgi:hypothetical protein
VRAEVIFAAGYFICAIIALVAWRTRPNAEAAATAPFWLRIAIICGIFTVLRYVDAQITVSHAVRDFSHAAHLRDWTRPGPYLMLLAIALVGAAVLGLFVFKLRTLHKSVFAAALAIVLLVLLAVAHSASLYLTGAVLQVQAGPLTISRWIEAPLLLIVALSGIWFIADASPRRSPR